MIQLQNNHYLNYLLKKQEKIRQEAEKYATIRNICVLKIICKQIDKELSIPTEYETPENRSTAQVNVIEEEEDIYQGVAVDKLDDEELLYYQKWRSRNRYQSSSRFGKYKPKRRFERPYGTQQRRDFIRNYPSNSNDKTAYNKSGKTWTIKSVDNLCSYCVRFGHKKDDCFFKKAADTLQEMKEQEKSPEDIISSG